MIIYIYIYIYICMNIPTEEERSPRHRAADEAPRRAAREAPCI